MESIKSIINLGYHLELSTNYIYIIYSIHSYIIILYNMHYDYYINNKK